MRQKSNPFSAHSMDNGIIFYSGRHKDCATIATIDDEGAITTSWTTIDEEQPDKFDIKFILIILPLIILNVMLLQWKPIYGIRFLMILFILSKLLDFILVASMMGKQRKRFQSAMHMVLNAYRKLGRVPSLEEIHQYSRFSKYCSTSITTMQIMDFILILVCSFLTPFNVLIPVFGSTIICILCLCGFLNFLQKFTTLEPTDKELSVAIAGMNVLVENEKKREGII